MKSMGVFCEHQLVTDWINDSCLIQCTSEKLLLDVAVGLLYIALLCSDMLLARTCC